MRNPELSQHLRRIKDLIERTRYATDNIELQGHWGRYLCVQAAGFIENSLQTVYGEFASNSSSPQAAAFIANRLRQVTNPKAARFLEIAGLFNSEWRSGLYQFMARDNGIGKSAIDSIMNLRNQIVHGGNAPISVAQVADYLDSSVAVIDFIEGQCLGNA